jgi:hypothetical protein
MPLVVERLSSREATIGQNPARILRYHVDGTNSDLLAEALIDAASPAVYCRLVKQSIKMRPGAGPFFWYGDVTYGPKPQGKPGDCTWQFDIDGPSVHITHSLKTIGRYAPEGAQPPDHKGAIGVTQDGAIEGCDIEGKSFQWSETHWLSYDQLTPEYIGTLYQLKSTVNKDTWRIWQPKEVLFRGVSGSSSGEDTVSLTFRFAAEPNKQALTVGPIVGIAKKGWEYLWVESQHDDDIGANAMVLRPKAAHVEEVYEEGDFTKLGLADPWNPE